MLKKSTISLLTVASLLGTVSIATSGEMPSKEEMWKMLQSQQQEINDLKSKLTSQPATQANKENTDTKKAGLHWSDRITISGVVEVSANTAKNYAKVSTSDATLDTVELAIDAQVTDMVSAHVLLLHEEAGNAAPGTTEMVDVDEATITLGNTEQFPLYLTAGRMAVPFGNFSSKLINDSLPLQLAETKETAIQVGFLADGFYGSVYTFNGDSKKLSSSDTIDQFGANLGYAGKFEGITLDVGASFMNSIEDSEGLTAIIPAATLGAIQQHVDGAGVHAVLEYEGFSLMGEYITATERFTNAEVA